MKIGNIEIKNPIILAPMEGVTDRPFRLICKRLGADIVFSEFTSSEAIIRKIPKSFKKIEVTDEERPFVVQIFGYQEESMKSATKIVEQFNPDIIDINCGCASKKHVTRGECAALLKDIPQFKKIVSAVVKSTKIPVTVKTRLGWDKDNINIVEIAKMVEQLGVKALTVHCRTRCQGYKGSADWSWLEKIRKEISIPLIGNGDILDEKDVKKIFEIGCNGVMIGRGAISNPWIFKKVKYFLEKNEYFPDPTIKERIDICLAHLRLVLEHKSGKNGILFFRKYYSGYLKGLPNVSSLRNDLIKLVDLDQIVDRLHLFLRESKK